MKNRLVTLVLALAVFAISAFAGDPSGKWKYSFTTPNGDTRESNMTLKAEGAKLTGTMEGRGGAVEIQEGKVDGDNLSFVVVRNFNGNEMKINYKGVLKGDELKLTMGFGDREMEITAKRVQ
ncbi:MAG: hypothetical protein JNK48_26225 [Bryobacterales bacterium]|nr:hypothetical protein [Bryobacterales bacterium]